MNLTAQEQTIDDIVEDFDLSQISLEGPTKREPVTFWLPAEYKAKYDLIQQRSKREFGKLLKEVLKRSIDKIKMED